MNQNQCCSQTYASDIGYNQRPNYGSHQNQSSFNRHTGIKRVCFGNNCNNYNNMNNNSVPHNNYPSLGAILPQTPALTATEQVMLSLAKSLMLC